jgi:cellulose synthase/poly-beta-1,6-N-acetylglucosamine synthase-like glycosyltransferase
MMQTLEIAFWLALWVGVYPYVIYPLLAALVGAIRRREVRCADAFQVPVSVVIAAHNEAAFIEQTVRNKLGQQYPPDLLEVIVVSDGSTDGTDEVLSRLAAEDPRVQWMRQEPRAGKSAALNMAVAQARGDLVVFSDANSLYHPDAISRIVKDFSDPEVGYVTGKMIYRSQDQTTSGDGCSAYMRFENWLRVQETRIGSIVGVDGGIDAIRRSLFRKLRSDQLPDFVTPLHVVAQNFRVIYEPGAVLEEDALDDNTSEFRMRVRVTLRALWAMRDCADLLSFRHRPLFAWQLWSHKLLRYFAFLPLSAALLLAIPLAAVEPLYRALLLPAMAILLLAAAGIWLQSRGTTMRAARFIQYFVLLNAACAVAAVRFARGERITVWKPRTG